MLIKEREFKGLFEIDFKPHQDDRGFFMRTYDDKIFDELGLDRVWVQESQSHSFKKGTVRGIHFQYPPHVETKLIRVISGEIYFVFLDLRKGSPTFGKWDSITLSANDNKMVWIPRGMALGMCTLTDNCDILYKMDTYYVSESVGTIQWNDPDLEINWLLEGEPILSEKDSKAMNFKEFVEKHKGLEVGEQI